VVFENVDDPPLLVQWRHDQFLDLIVLPPQAWRGGRAVQAYEPEGGELVGHETRV
jgi:hypothetical protein